MTRNRSSTALAALLAALAGLVDALGFRHLQGFFVSFMSGNTTRMAVSFAQGETGSAARAGSLIFAFFVGAVAGAALRHSVARHRRAAVLALVTVALFAAAALQRRGLDGAAVSAMAFAMGVENAVFVNAGRVSVGLTYVTGALVKTAQGLVAALFGERPFTWVPDALLWLALVVGALAGSNLYDAIGLDGLWVAGGLAAICLAWTLADRRRLDGEHA